MDAKQLGWLFFGLSGRISRAAYFWAGLLLFVLLFFTAYQALLAVEGSDAGTFWVTLSWASSFVFLWSHVALGVKRLHDIGKSGAYALLIPLFVALAFIILSLLPGDPGPNDHGEHTNAPL